MFLGTFLQYTTLLLLGSLLVIATRIIVDIDEIMAYVMCALCAGISGALFLALPDFSEFAHTLSISLVTLYQSHFAIEEVNAVAQLEWGMLVVVVGVYLSDYYVWYLAWRHEASTASADARRWHGAICNFVLASMAYIPLPGAGLFNIGNSGYLVAFVLLQIALSATEKLRNIRTVHFSTPHPALKCLPLLYLPPRLWIVLAGFLKLNIIFLYLDRRRVAKEDHS